MDDRKILDAQPNWYDEEMSSIARELDHEADLLRQRMKVVRLELDCLSLVAEREAARGHFVGSPERAE